MKYLIVPTQQFSGSVKGKKWVDFSDLPKLVQRFITWTKKRMFVALDESSWIKTTQAMNEEKKSQRTRVIKTLANYSESRAILTGTLKSKSPMNLIDQYQFLDPEYFPESMYEFAERYCIMVTLHTARGRRVIINQKDYKDIRTRLANAYKRYNEQMYKLTYMKICNSYGLRSEQLEHIIAHKEYSPFMHQDELMERVAHCTMTVKREDVFDISYDKAVYEPIMRPVKLDKQAIDMANELIDFGFTDTLVLGKAPALELVIRLQDICNGFEPIKDEATGLVTYKPLKANPKLDELEALLEEIGTDDNQVVVWCSRTNAKEAIYERLEKLGISYVGYSGSEGKAKKAEAEEKFASGEARVFVANQAAAAYGLNCLKDCNYIVWFCCDASVERHHQAQHRILRGQSRTLKFAYMIYVKNSVEERVIRALNVGEELLSDNNSKEIFRFAA